MMRRATFTTLVRAHRALASALAATLAVSSATALPPAGPAATVDADGKGMRFASIAFHDVVDRREDRADDAVTTQSLVDFFDWLKAEGWTPVPMSAVIAAGAGGPPLPEKAILLTFDDGYQSFYDRVFPLLLAYRYPAVLALVSSWLDVPPGGMVDYGGVPTQRSAFVSWDAVRRMQASGLVEIASHSHDLHRVTLSTRQGNTAPAARTWAFATGSDQREDDTAHRARIRTDLEIASRRIADETGIRPRVIVWPFGRFSGPAVEAARAAGFDHALTLEPEIADARQPMALHRYYPTQDPSLGIKAWNLAFAPPRPASVRLACVDLAPLAGQTAAEADRRLGALVEDVRALGASAIMVDLVPRTGPLVAWLPTPALPMAEDIFSRAARQLGSRAGVQVFARLPVERAETLGDAALAQLGADAARAAPIDGLVIADPTFATTPPDVPPTPAVVRAARTASPDRAARLFAAAAAIDPRLRLISAGAWGPAADSDRRLLTDGPTTNALVKAGWLAPEASGRVVIPLPTGTVRAQAAALAAAQRRGASAFLACPWDAGTKAQLAKAFSAATFPYRP